MNRRTEADVMRPALLADFEMHQQNQAREEFKKLELIITTLIIPVIGKQHPISKDLYAHLENVKYGSQNFCWQHRYLGYSYAATEAGGAQ